MGRKKNLIDLSHEVQHGLVTYPGLPAPIICDFLSREQSRQYYAPGTEFQIGRIDMVANTGTYVDAPFHRFAGGKTLADLPLESLAELPAVVVRPERNGQREISAALLEQVDVAGCAVLVHTGWSRHWATEQYFSGHPFLNEEAAYLLRDRGAVLVGIDSLNIDSTDDGRRPVHTTLLGADIPICEHLRGLEALPASGFTFSAVPVKVKGFGTFPVRAYAAL
jgi:arylformamidase